LEDPVKGSGVTGWHEHVESVSARGEGEGKRAIQSYRAEISTGSSGGAKLFRFKKPLKGAGKTSQEVCEREWAVVGGLRDRLRDALWVWRPEIRKALNCTGTPERKYKKAYQRAAGGVNH